VEIVSLISKPAQRASFPALILGNCQLRGRVMATSSQHRPGNAPHLVSQSDCRHVVMLSLRSGASRGVW
jgi:hypothetical protein